MRLSNREKRRQLAIALRYDVERDTSPRVIAKGKGSMAKRILDIARDHNIPVRDDPDLAETLSQLELGDFIPQELYPAVAEVLAWVYRINGRTLKN